MELLLLLKISECFYLDETYKLRVNLMTIFVYGPSHPTNHNVANLEVLTIALANNAVTDASLSLATDLTIDTATGTQLQCDAAVIAADKTGLLHAQVTKINSIIAFSPELLDLGFKPVIAGVTYQLSLNKHNSDCGYFGCLKAKITANPGLLPLEFLDSNKVVVPINTLGNATVLENQAFQQLKYIYFDQVNADGSMGEAGYVIAIRAAANVAAVNDIVDTRV